MAIIDTILRGRRLKIVKKGSPAYGDKVEVFLGGNWVPGKIREINKDANWFGVELQSGNVYRFHIRDLRFKK